jgi:hypothetical protein
MKCNTSYDDNSFMKIIDGSTLHGGLKYEIFYYDVDIQPCCRSDAMYFDIHEIGVNNELIASSWTISDRRM